MRFFHANYSPIYVPAVLSFAGTLFYLYADRLQLIALLADRWSLHYLIATPFIHAGAAHFIFNVMALHYVGGQMLLPLMGRRHFIALLAIGAIVGNLLNNILSPTPAIGISSAIMALLACALYPYGKVPMKFLFIHDILRLPPFQFRHIAAFIVALDICGIIFNWHFFAHFAHLGGFVSGAVFGYFRFKYKR